MNIAIDLFFKITSYILHHAIEKPQTKRQQPKRKQPKREKKVASKMQPWLKNYGKWKTEILSMKKDLG